MSVSEVVKGPNTGGPAAGPLTVIGSPTAGISPKLLVQDAEGQRFVLKLDVPEYPELASTAELICSLIFHAAGYNVPETYILRLRRERLQVGEAATWENAAGEQVPILPADVDFWLRNSATYDDGTHRVLASKFIPGTHVGEFRFHGTRPDDPNDIFPHEHRRELRGYRVFSAWLNHDDSRATNTYDSFVGSPESGYIKHYLLDFGSCLGSATVEPQKTRGGHEYLFEPGPLLKSMATLGFWYRPWLQADLEVEYAAVGRLEASYFDPEAWKPEYPSAAFDNMDAADAFWAARIVARFSDAMIRALVDAARISDPAAARHLGDLIIERRDKVVAAWLTKTQPLDGFRVRDGHSAGASAAMTVLEWDNAALRHGLISADPGYEARWFRFDNRTGRKIPLGEAVFIDTPNIVVPEAAWGPQDDHGARYATVEIVARGARGDGRDQPAPPAVVTVRRRSGNIIDVVGVRRAR
jgi:hypothetical protein